jgi:hypothetical protein
MGWNITCHEGISFHVAMDEKNGCTFIKMDAKPMKNHEWANISLIKGGIISCWFYLEKYNT